jgi:hypothetical protein
MSCTFANGEFNIFLNLKYIVTQNNYKEREEITQKLK